MSNKDKVEDMEQEPQEAQTAKTPKEETTTTTKPDTDKTEEEATVSKEDQLQDELDKEKDKCLRLFAEFENYKKRISKERIALFKTAGQEILTALLPILDDFDRALKELSKSEDKEMLKGVELIHNKFRETLKNKGLEQIEVATGDAFDAEVHDAITQVPAADETMKGKIIDVVEKGYKLGERIIRHPKVVVGN